MSLQEHAGIDFGGFITEKTHSFTGREWVFKELHLWLSQPNEPRFFLLNGKPGSGKTAIAARLCQFSRDEATPPDGLSLFSKDFLAAYHFCSARDSNWIDPRSFVWSVALQLAKRYDEFAKALISAGDTPVSLSGEANAEVAEQNSVVAGIIIKNLSLSGMNSQEAFNRFLVGPLQKMYQQGFSQPITILVDSLDESLNHSGNVTIASLLARVKHLPSQVRFIVTSRDDDRLTIDFLEDSKLVPLSESRHRSDNDKDIANLVRLQMSNVNDLKQKTASLSTNDLDQLIGTIVQQAEGNFLYVAFLLNSLAMPHHSLSDLDSLPTGLEGLYYDSIKRVVSLGSGTWQATYSPLMGVLSVAQSPFTIDQIEQFTQQAANEVWLGINDLQQFIAKTNADSNSPNLKLVYRLYHQSVIDFLHTPLLKIKGNAINNAYLLQSSDWHLRIVNHYVAQSDLKQWDDYGLRYFATHLSEAAKVSKGAQQHQHVERLVEFVCNPDFWLLHKQRINDLNLLQRDLDRALKAAAANTGEKSLTSLVKIAMSTIAFRREELRPDPLFELARQGDVAAAIRRLDLFDVDADWKLVALLVIAWLAVDKKPEEARRLLDQVKEGTTYTQSISWLIARLDAELDNSPLTLPSLPSSPSEEVAMGLVSNLGGKAVDIELLMAHHDAAGQAAVPFADGPDSGPTPGYFSERDAPYLVAYAENNKPHGDKYLRQYIAIHTSYNYVQYRNRSLLHLLAAALRASDRQWVQEMTVSLTVAALAGNALEFQEGLPSTLSTLLVERDSTIVDWRRQLLIDESDKLAHERGEGDSWGFFRRRLGSKAQVYTVLLNAPNVANDLLERARSLPYGFAGFNAPASLFLAEATQICDPANSTLINRFLEAALNSAHNIQDVIFCARSTARVNAMRERWWDSAPSNISDVIQRLTSDPTASEFTALHRVGEEYKNREPPPQSAPFPAWFFPGNTLDTLSAIHQRPVSEFLRVNRQQGWTATDTLPEGTAVNVPDPGFATQLAARFSAEVLRAPSLSPEERVRLIQQLVPLASLSPTALDTVCSRLILAAQPLDNESLSTIQRLALNSFKAGLSPTNAEQTLRIFYPET